MNLSYDWLKSTTVAIVEENKLPEPGSFDTYFIEFQSPQIS